jgi:Type VI secretion system, TssF
MATHTKSRKAALPPSVAALCADLRREVEAGAAEHARRVIETFARDRVALRPGVAVAEVRPTRDEQVVRTGDLFFAAAPAGQIDFVATRDEVVPPISLTDSGPVEEARPVVPGRWGYRAVLAKPAETPWPDRFRFYLSDAASAQAVYQGLFVGGGCVARPDGGEWRAVRVLPTAAEHAAGLFPTAPLGCWGRALLSAWFHAPFAFPFFDVTGLAEVGGTADSIEVVFLFRDPALPSRLPAGSIRTGCVPLVNRRAETVLVTVEATTAFTTLPVPAGQAVAGVGRVQVFRGQGEWAECRPWLGDRHPWRHKTPVPARYALSAPGGLTPPGIGLIEPGADLSSADATHLHVELFLADTQVHTIPAGAAVGGNGGQRAELVAAPAPLLVPAAIDPAELEAEAKAAGWLGRGGEADVTEALRVVLERAAGPLTTARGGRPSGLPLALAQIDGLVGAATRPGPVVGGFPGTEIEVELDAGRFVDRAPFLFAAALERALGFFARPLTYTRLKVRTEGGELVWSPRLPVS